MKLEGKRILVTGGSSGIGFSLAQALLARGAKVVISGRRPHAVSTAVAALRSGNTVVAGVASDVSTDEGRAATLTQAMFAMGGVDVLINNAGGVRAGRLDQTSEADILAMITVDLVAPILLTRAALPLLRKSGDAMVVNIASGIALIGAPFYTAYAAAKAGLGRFGEALRREMKGEGVHVLTAYPGATDTPMMQSNRAGPELGFSRESPEAVALAIVGGMETDAFEVIRGGEARTKMIELNRADPGAVDARFFGMKAELEAAVKDHSAL